MTEHLALLVLAKTVASSPNLWLSLFLPLGIALIGLAGTLSVMWMQLRARRLELQADRDERVSEAKAAQVEHDRDARASALEDIMAAIVDHATALGDLILGSEIEQLGREETMRFPSNFQVKRALARLTTRANERPLTDAALGYLKDAMNLTLHEQPLVYGILQERLEFWFTGERSVSETIQKLNSDAASFRAGHIPAVFYEEDSPIAP